MTLRGSLVVVVLGEQPRLKSTHRSTEEMQLASATAHIIYIGGSSKQQQQPTSIFRQRQSSSRQSDRINHIDSQQFLPQHPNGFSRAQQLPQSGGGGAAAHPATLNSLRRTAITI